MEMTQINLADENERLKVENEALIKRVAALEKEVAAFKDKLVTQLVTQSDGEAVDKIDFREKSPVPKIEGWSIVKIAPKNPKHSSVYHAKRKIKGRVFTAYIGKSLDADKAVKKIRAKERELSKKGFKLSDFQKGKGA